MSQLEETNTDPVETPQAEPAPAKTEKPRRAFMPAFWTIASVISLSVNLILLIV